MSPLAVLLVVVIFVKLADGADKNTSAVNVCPSIIEPVMFPLAVMSPVAQTVPSTPN